MQKKWRVFAPWNNSVVSEHFPSLEAVFKLKREIISKGPQNEIFVYQVAGKDYYVKRYFRAKGIRSWIGFSRLRVEAKNQQWFNKIGVPAARVVAYGENFFFLKTLKGALITEGVDDTKDLEYIAKNEGEQFHQAAWRDNIILELAGIVTTLHFHRFCHNDLHWRNILIQQSLGDDKPRVYLIDCPSGKRLFWPILHYRQIKDLAILDKVADRYLSRTQRLKFFLAYRQTNCLSDKDKQLIGEIFIHKARRLKREGQGW